MRTERSLAVLRMLMKNSKLSDREIAKLLKTSQPTITRTRKRLEEEGYISSYTVIPDFEKMGYTILAFTFTKMRSYPNPEKALEIKQHAASWVNERPNVIFAADGQGLGGKDVVMVSFHRNFKEYTTFMQSYALEWGDIISTFENFMVSVGSKFTMKPLDLKYLAKDKLP